MKVEIQTDPVGKVPPCVHTCCIHPGFLKPPVQAAIEAPAQVVDLSFQCSELGHDLANDGTNYTPEPTSMVDTVRR